MKILYLTGSVQHPALQSSFRHYYFLRELAQRHEITLLTLSRGPVPAAVLEDLRGQAARVVVIEALRSPRPQGHPLLRPAADVARRLQQARRQRAALTAMGREFRRLAAAERFDLVVFHGHAIFGVIDGWHGVPLVIDLCDARSTLMSGAMRHAPWPSRPLHWLRYLRTRQRERRMLRCSPHVAFISCRDREAILGAASTAAVIPNAVDLEYWTRGTAAPEPNTLLFHGAMDYRPNVDAALQLIRTILPRVHAANPAVRLLIVGRDPTPELRAAAARARGVTLTGAVPDVRPFLERATVYAAPLRFGAGQQNKLLEAMAMQIPVVTSENGASGLRVGPAPVPVQLAAPGEAFAAALLRLLADPVERARLAAEGRAYIAGHFGIDRSVQLLESMCLAAAGQPAGTHAPEPALSGSAERSS